MLFIESPSFDPEFNLALEQHVFDNLSVTEDCFMLWRNDNAVIVGRNQNTYAEIDDVFVREKGIKVVRRLSGGGAVYHDLGNLNFTFITACREGGELDFARFCGPIVNVLRSLGIDAEISGRNDMTIAGKKFSGNSQYVKFGRAMHHGTLMFDCDLDMVEGALNVSADKLESKGVKSVRNRVTNISSHLPGEMSIEEFSKALSQRLYPTGTLRPYTLTQADLDSIHGLMSSRYSLWEWNFGQSPAHSQRRARHFDNVGQVEVMADVKNGLIAAISIFGDYFGLEPMEKLTKALTGQPLDAKILKPLLAELPVEKYIRGMTADDFLTLLL